MEDPESGNFGYGNGIRNTFNRDVKIGISEV